MPRPKRAGRAAAGLAALMLVVSCASRGPAPPSDDALRARYDEDLAACRARVQSMDMLRQTLDGIVEGALVTALVVWGLGRSQDALRDGAAIGGLLGGASQGLHALERRRQAEIGCMAARGHGDHHPGLIAVAPVTQAAAPMPPAMPPVPVGMDSFNAERLARGAQCSSAPLAVLVAKGAGFETYSVPCDNGDAWAVRCEFGNCRVLR